MARIDFGGVKENIVTRKEFPMYKARSSKKRNHCGYRLRRTGSGPVTEPEG